MSIRWSSELWRVLSLLAICVVAGLMLGHLYEAVVIGLAGIVALQLFQLRRLACWIGSAAGANDVPEARGVWGELYHRIHQLQRNNLERQRQLTSLLHQFQRSAEAMPDAVVSLTRNFEIRWFNEAATRLLKLRPRQDVGQAIGNLIRSPQFQAYLGKKQFAGSLEIKAPGDGELRLAVRVIPYGEQEYLMLAQDITERHRLERVRKDFVANVSHELRTPLTVISGFVENLQHDESGCGEKWRRPLQLMRQQATRMQRIVEDLLLLANLEATQGTAMREAVDVKEMLQEIMEETVAVQDPGEERDIRLEAESALLYGSSLQLRSAFANLVTNAAKYTPTGGRIDIRWFTGPQGGVLEVRDTGEGIAPEHIPRLTERFYRVDVGRSRAKGGTGLGLAIVKHVLQKHAARLEIETEVGRGSVFRCVFPSDRLAEGDRAFPTAQRPAAS